MFKHSLLCTAVLCASMVGQPRAEEAGEHPTAFRLSELPSEPRPVDYTQEVEELDTRSETNNATQAMLTAISDWLSKQFDLPVADEQPRVQLVPAARIAAIRIRPFRYLQAQSANDQAMLEAESTIMAVYEDATQTIYLPEGWRGVSPAEQSVLVHEMVHHLQSRGNLKYECAQDREKLAFKAQERWLRRFDSSLADEFGMDSFTLLVRTSCLG